MAPDHKLRVLWSDGHRSEYTPDWLLDHDLIASARNERRPKYHLWGKEIGNELPVGDWPEMLAHPAKELAWLDRYAELGFGLLRNVPAKEGMVAEVGDHLGFVRVTNYGRLFDVKSVPNPNNLADTSLGLGVHSDNPYRHPSPGVQLLHCLIADAPGGDTLLVDGFAAAEILRKENPGRVRAALNRADDLPLFQQQRRARGQADVDQRRHGRGHHGGAFQQPLGRLAGCAGRSRRSLVQRLSHLRWDTEATGTRIDLQARRRATW